MYIERKRRMDAVIESIRETVRQRGITEEDVAVEVTAAREGVFTLAMTPLFLSELRRVVSREKFGLHPDAIELLMDGIEACATIVYPRKLHQVVLRDSDDDAVVDCAVDKAPLR
jgi:hypothetical protein